MHPRKHVPFFILVMLLWSGALSSAPGVKVVYPEWFKQSFYDLQDDLQDALVNGKHGVAVFFSEKSCSYCKAMVERTFQQPDIAQRLSQNYDVVGLDVFSDLFSLIYSREVRGNHRYTSTILRISHCLRKNKSSVMNIVFW